MKMFEKLGIDMGCACPTHNEMTYANMIYGRYVDTLDKLCGPGHETKSLAEFLLCEVESFHMDSFMWGKDTLVKTKDGEIGITTGWSKSFDEYKVLVRTASGGHSFYSDEIEETNIPPEVLEYVKSTLLDKVHDKVDEAFKEG